MPELQYDRSSGFIRKHWRITTAALNRHQIWFFLFITAFLATLLTLIVYPGIYYSDSYVRLDYAAQFLEGKRPAEIWISLVPSMLMAGLYTLVNNMAIFTWMQCFLLLFSGLLLSAHLLGSRWGVGLLLLLSPTYICYSVYCEAGVLCLAALQCLLLIIWQLCEATSDPPIKTAMLSALSIFFSFVALGARQNAFTVLPAFAVMMIVLVHSGTGDKKRWFKLILPTATLLLGAVLAALAPAMMGIRSLNSSTAGFVWDILSAVDQLSEENREEYEAYLDQIGGEGATAKALEAYRANDESVNAWLWEIFPPELIGTTENTKFIYHRYFDLFKSHPSALVLVKMQSAGRTLGVLFDKEYDYDRAGWMERYHFNDSPQRQGFVYGYQQFSDSIAYLRAPWLVFGITLLLLLAGRLLGASIQKPIILFLVAACYYGAFLINQQSYEFRYFFPSYMLLIVASLAIIVQLPALLMKRKATNIQLPKGN